MYEEFYLKHLEKSLSSGGEVRGCCPFHDDKNPSFSANIETGQAYCHGCGWKGNTFTFAKKVGNIPFQLRAEQLEKIEKTFQELKENCKTKKFKHYMI